MGCRQFFINIGGLAVGMAVVILIGLWIWDELSFNTYHQNYTRIAKVMQSASVNGEFGAGEHMPLPLANTLRTDFADDFTYVVISSWNGEHILAYGDKKFTKTGSYMSPEVPDMFTLKMLQGLGQASTIPHPFSCLNLLLRPFLVMPIRWAKS